jgi:hypothetical protein
MGDAKNYDSDQGFVKKRQPLPRPISMLRTIVRNARKMRAEILRAKKETKVTEKWTACVQACKALNAALVEAGEAAEYAIDEETGKCARIQVPDAEESVVEKRSAKKKRLNEGASEVRA